MLSELATERQQRCGLGERADFNSPSDAMNQSNANQLCSPGVHLSRRTILGAGAGSALLSSIAGKLAASERAGKNETSPAKKVILLWLTGGPSQLETFDPHAGTRIGGDVKAIDTTVKGLQVADLLPQVAEQMHLASLVRSVIGKEGDHARGRLQHSQRISARSDA